MATRDRLRAFVGEALAAGQGRERIAAALREAGWSEPEIRHAFAAWADEPFTPPVPRPTRTVSARDAFVYLLIFLSLILSAYHLTSLLHAIVDLTVPDPLPSHSGAEGRVRWSISMLVVFGPLYLWLTWREARATAADPGQRRSAVRDGVTWLALFVAACVFLGDLVALIHGFLDGELSLLFGLKLAAVALVSGAVFLFYLREARR